MKYVQLENDFKVDREKVKDVPPNTELTLNWIGHGMDNGFKNGITSDKRRMRAGIVAKLEDASKKLATELELNPFEYKFIMDAFNAGTCSLQETFYITTVENALLAATDVSQIQSGTAQTAPVPMQASPTLNQGNSAENAEKKK